MKSNNQIRIDKIEIEYMKITSSLETNNRLRIVNIRHSDAVSNNVSLKRSVHLLLLYPCKCSANK